MTVKYPNNSDTIPVPGAVFIMFRIYVIVQDEQLLMDSQSLFPQLEKQPNKLLHRLSKYMSNKKYLGNYYY